MTDRERWTVYPLIFLTLGLALKDKLVEVEVVDVQCRNLICNAVHVTDAEGRQRAVVSFDAEGGYVRTNGTKDGLTVILGHTEQLGGLLFVDRKGGVHVNPGSIYRAPRTMPQAPSKKADDKPEVPPPDAETPPDSAP